MSLGARVFVALLFIALGLSFIATTATLYYEFKDTNWFSFAAFYSHLFIFFPTFGIVALLAFYLPAVASVDWYWYHLPFGRLRFVIWALAVGGASFYLAQKITEGRVPTLWEVTPETLRADKGEPAGCISSQQTCKRIPVLEALATVRQQSQRRAGLSLFARECNPDPLLEIPPDLLEKRYCFVTKTLLPAAECCKAQKRFTEALAQMNEVESQRSLTGRVHALLLPLKVGFLLLLLLIGLLLAIWRKEIDQRFKPYISHIELGILVGAFAMLFWPVSNQAFLQSASVLYGAYGRSFYSILSVVMGITFLAWALMLLFFFFRRYEKDLEAAGKIIGVVGSAVAILKYDVIIDYFQRFVGSGADWTTIGVFSLIGIFIIFQLARTGKGLIGLLDAAEDMVMGTPEPENKAKSENIDGKTEKAET